MAKMRSPGLKSRVIFQEGRCPGSEAQGGGAAVQREDAGRRTRGEAPGAAEAERMPRESRQACQGEHRGRLKQRNPKGGAYGEREDQGGEDREGWESEGRAASRSSPASARPPQPQSYPSRLGQVLRSTTEKTPPPEAEMLLSPRFPFLPPYLSSGFFPPGLEPQVGGGLGERKIRWQKGNVPFPTTHNLSPPTCFPTVSAPGCLPLSSRAGRGHFPATARSEATEGGRGEPPPPAHLPGPRC